MNIDFENKKKVYTIGFSLAIAFMLLYFLINVSAVSGFFSGIFSVISPILIGATIAYLLNPLLKLFEYKILRKLKNKNMRRILSLILTYVSMVLIIVVFLLIIIPQIIKSIVDLASRFDEYIANTQKLLNDLLAKIEQNPEIAQYVNKEEILSTISEFFSDSQDIMSTVLTYVKNIGVGVFTGVKNLLLGLFISIYILISKESLHAGVRKITAAVFKEKTGTRMLRYTRIANRTFGNYFIGVLVDACMVGIVSLVIFAIFRIPYAPLIATVVGVTNVIPIFGPFIGAIPSAFIILIRDPSKVILFIILVLVIQQIDGNIIAPKILGNSTGISSLGVIVAIIIMGECFGIVGMIVGVPVFAMIIMVINEIIETKLKDKGLPTRTEEYYPAYSLVDPHDHHEKFGAHIIKMVFGGTYSFIKKIISKLRKQEPENKEENTEEDQRKDKKDKNE